MNYLQKYLFNKILIRNCRVFYIFLITLLFSFIYSIDISVANRHLQSLEFNPTVYLNSEEIFKNIRLPMEKNTDFSSKALANTALVILEDMSTLVELILDNDKNIKLNAYNLLDQKYVLLNSITINESFNYSNWNLDISVNQLAYIGSNQFIVFYHKLDSEGSISNSIFFKKLSFNIIDGFAITQQETLILDSMGSRNRIISSIYDKGNSNILLLIAKEDVVESANIDTKTVKYNYFKRILVKAKLNNSSLSEQVVKEIDSSFIDTTLDQNKVFKNLLCYSKVFKTGLILSLDTDTANTADFLFYNFSEDKIDKSMVNMLKETELNSKSYTIRSVAFDYYALTESNENNESWVGAALINNSENSSDILRVYFFNSNNNYSTKQSIGNYHDITSSDSIIATLPDNTKKSFSINSNTNVNYIKIIGRFIYVNLSNPNILIIYLRDYDKDNNKDQNYLIKFYSLLEHSSNNHINNIVIYEKIILGLAIPIISYTDLDKEESNLVYVSMSSDKKCLTIANYIVETNKENYFCVTNCFSNQYFNSSMDKCFECKGDSKYVLNYSCVKTCPDNLASEENFCKNSNSVANKSYNNNQQYIANINNNANKCLVYQTKDLTTVSLNGYCRYCSYFNEANSNINCDSTHSNCEDNEILACNNTCISKSLLVTYTNPMTDLCNECLANEYYSVTSKQCILKENCSEDTIANENTNRCECSIENNYLNINYNNSKNKCSTSCGIRQILIKVDGLNLCYTCPENLIADGTICVKSCPNNTIYDDANKKCISCTGDNYIYENTCIKTCPDKYGKDVVEFANKCVLCDNYKDLELDKCVDSCDNSKESNDKDKTCSYCPTDKVAYNNECLDSCPEGLTAINVSENSSSKKCITCITENNICKEDCTIHGNIKNTDSNTCIRCDKFTFENNFLTCENDCLLPKKIFYNPDNNNAGYCKECLFPTQFKQNNECVDFCTINGLVKNFELRECIPCNNNQFEDKGICVEKCPGGSVSVDYIFRYCQYCNINEYSENNKCVSKCNEPRNYMNNDTKSCDKCLEEKYFYNYKCYDICPEGTISTENEIGRVCKICYNDFYIEDNKCVDECKKLWHVPVIYDNYNICKPCDNNQYAFENQCLELCPDDSMTNNYPYKHCVKCTEQNNYKFNGNCYDQCPIGTISNENKECKLCYPDFFDVKNKVCVTECNINNAIEINVFDLINEKQAEALEQSKDITEDNENTKQNTDEENIQDSSINNSNDNEVSENTENKTNKTNQKLCVTCNLLKLDTKECVTKCPESYEEINKTCVKKKQPPTIYYLDTKELDSCPEGYRPNKYNICIKCSTTNCLEACLPEAKFIKDKFLCERCTDKEETKSSEATSSNEIISINSSDSLEDTAQSNITSENNDETNTAQKRLLQSTNNKICTYECPLGYYNGNNKSNQLQNLDNTKPDNFNCLRCESLYQDELCVESCSIGYVSNENKVCTSCKSNNKYYQENKCVDECNPQYMLDDKLNVCLPCTEDYCNNNGICLIEKSNNFKCQCNELYFGKFCSYKISEKPKMLENLKKSISSIELKVQELKKENQDNKKIDKEALIEVSNLIDSEIENAISFGNIQDESVFNKLYELLSYRIEGYKSNFINFETSIFNKINYIYDLMIENNYTQDINGDFAINDVAMNILSECDSVEKCSNKYVNGFIANQPLIKVQYSKNLINQSIKSTENINKLDESNSNLLENKTEESISESLINSEDSVTNETSSVVEDNTGENSNISSETDNNNNDDVSTTDSNIKIEEENTVITSSDSTTNQSTNEVDNTTTENTNDTTVSEANTTDQNTNDTTNTTSGTNDTNSETDIDNNTNTPSDNNETTNDNNTNSDSTNISSAETSDARFLQTIMTNEEQNSSLETTKDVSQTTETAKETTNESTSEMVVNSENSEDQNEINPVQNNNNISNQLEYTINKYPNLPLIDYSKCQETLINNNVILNSDSLFSLISLKSSELNNAKYTSDYLSLDLINNKGKMIYDESCKEVDIYFPLANIDEEILKDYNKLLSKYNVDLFEKDSKFFNSFCYKFKDTNYTDTTINQRRNMFNAVNICDYLDNSNKSNTNNKCVYKGIYNNKYSICRCNPLIKNIYNKVYKKDISKEDNYIESNVNIIYCVDYTDVPVNQGFWLIFIITLIALFVILIQLLFKSKRYIQDNMLKIMFSDMRDCIDKATDINIYNQEGYSKLELDAFGSHGNRVLNINKLEEKDKEVNENEYDNNIYNPFGLNKVFGKTDEKQKANITTNNKQKSGLNKSDNHKHANSEPKDSETMRNLAIKNNNTTSNRNDIEIHQNNELNTNNQDLIHVNYLNTYKRTFMQEVFDEFKFSHGIFNIANSYSLIYPFFLRVIVLTVNCSLDLLVISLFFIDRIIDKRAEYAKKNGAYSIGINYSFNNEIHFAIFTTLITIGFFFVFNFLIKAYFNNKMLVISSLRTKNSVDIAKA